MVNYNPEIIGTEDEILVLCATTVVNKKNKERISVLTKDVNWKYLIRISTKHKLNPLLYHNLISICPENVPKEVLSYLKQYYKLNLHKNLYLTGEMIKISRILKKENISFIVYKGPILAYFAYKNLSLREFRDIDFLISKEDAVRARKLLISNGYSDYVALEIEDKFYMKLESEYRFINKTNGAIIELKWKFHGNFMSLNEVQFLKEDLNEIIINGYNFETFSFVNSLIILCIHAAKHDWRRLAWISDISEMLKSTETIDWQNIIFTSEKLGTMRILLINLKLCRDLFNVELPDNLNYLIDCDHAVKKMARSVEETIFKNKKLSVFGKFYTDLKKRENLTAGVRDCINNLLRPTYADFRDLSLPRRIFRLYIIIRPFLLLKRYGLKYF